MSSIKYTGIGRWEMDLTDHDALKVDALRLVLKELDTLSETPRGQQRKWTETVDLIYMVVEDVLSVVAPLPEPIEERNDDE